MADKQYNLGDVDQAFDFSNAMQSYNLAKDNIKLKVENRLSYSVDGGTFEISQQLIAFVGELVKHDNTSAIIFDKNENPVHITNLPSMLENMINTYLLVSEEAFREMAQLEESRNIKIVFGAK